MFIRQNILIKKSLLKFSSIIFFIFQNNISFINSMESTKFKKEIIRYSELLQGKKRKYTKEFIFPEKDREICVFLLDYEEKNNPLKEQYRIAYCKNRSVHLSSLFTIIGNDTIINDLISYFSSSINYKKKELEKINGAKYNTEKNPSEKYGIYGEKKEITHRLPALLVAMCNFLKKNWENNDAEKQINILQLLRSKELKNILISLADAIENKSKHNVFISLFELFSNSNGGKKTMEDLSVVLSSFFEKNNNKIGDIIFSLFYLSQNFPYASMKDILDDLHSSLKKEVKDEIRKEFISFSTILKNPEFSSFLDFSKKAHHDSKITLLDAINREENNKEKNRLISLFNAVQKVNEPTAEIFLSFKIETVDRKNEEKQYRIILFFYKFYEKEKIKNNGLVIRLVFKDYYEMEGVLEELVKICGLHYIPSVINPEKDLKSGKKIILPLIDLQYWDLNSHLVTRMEKHIKIGKSLQLQDQKEERKVKKQPQD